jgi:long-chain acyl-CoA synthetase
MAAGMSRELPAETMPGLLRSLAQRYPRDLALREKKFGIWERTTFLEYFQNVIDFALGLDCLGFERNHILAVASEDTPEWLYADLAAQSLGGACVGIYPTNPWRELKFILAHSGASIVVCGDQEQTDKVLDAIADGDGLPAIRHIICVDMKGMRHYAEKTALLKSFADVAALGRALRLAGDDTIERRIAELSPDDAAVIVYTSGTTGMPKGAVLSHRGMIVSARNFVTTHNITRDNWSVLAYLPLCHVAERQISTSMQLLCANTVSFAESVDTVLRDLREIAPKAFLGIPRIWEKMKNSITIKLLDVAPFPRWVANTCIEAGRQIAERRLANNGYFASHRDRVAFFAFWFICFRPLQKWLGLNRASDRLFCGGASISPEVLKFFWGIGLKVYQIYGMTEMSGLTHSQYLGATVHGSCGHIVGDYQHRIAKDGEILIRSDAVFNGYLHDPDATAGVLKDGWFHTGDIGELGPDGSLFITDRKKDILITSGGKNITPSLIENRLKDSPYIREAILLGEGRHFISALIQIDLETVGKWAQGEGIPYTNYKNLASRPEVSDLIEKEIKAFNEDFARVEQVRAFRILQKELDHDDGEVTATMKVRRKAIEEKFAAEISSIYNSSAS